MSQNTKQDEETFDFSLQQNMTASMEHGST